jgi:chromosome segregation ATPase
MISEEARDELKKQMRNTLNRAEVMFEELQKENENAEISLAETKDEYKTMKGDYSQALSTIRELQEELKDFRDIRARYEIEAESQGERYAVLYAENERLRRVLENAKNHLRDVTPPCDHEYSRCDHSVGLCDNDLSYIKEALNAK